MLTEERHSIILDAVNKRKSVGLSELCGLLSTSESTIRRDLSLLNEKGLLTKVRGGAIALSADENFASFEPNVEEKAELFTAEKEAIARYAASLIEDGDYVTGGNQRTGTGGRDFQPSKDQRSKGVDSEGYGGRGTGEPCEAAGEA